MAMIIDAHAHLGKGDTLDDPLQIDAGINRHLKLMQKAEIDKSIVFPLRYDTYDQANIEIAEIVEKRPNLIGFARIKASHPEASHKVEYAIKELGLKGIKIHPDEGFPTRNTMDKINKLGVPVIFHTGFRTSPIIIEGIAATYPNLPVILAHIGTNFDFETRNAYGYPELAIALANQFKNVYVDTAAIYIYRYLEKAVLLLGADRVIFGSDSPEFHPAVARKYIEVLDISEQDKQKILGLNIARILNL